MRRVEGVRKASRYARFEELCGVRECFAGVAVRWLKVRFLLGVTWWGPRCRGVEDWTEREVDLDGVGWAEDGESRSNRPRTRPFF